MQVLIVGSGEDYSDSKVIELALCSNYIIASDGGYNLLNRLNIKPHILLGDMDSIDSSIDIPLDISIDRYKPEKDLSDSELSLHKALELGATKIVMVAMTGSYFDHGLANLLMLLQYDLNSKIRIVTANSEIFLHKASDGELDICNMLGRRFSFFALDDICELNMEGFKYQFKETDIKKFKFSLSNVIASHTAILSMKSGVFVGVLFDENYN